MSLRNARCVNSPGSARRAPSSQHARDHRFDDDRAAVAVQLEHVLAGVGMRRGEEQREPDVDRLLLRIEEPREA